MLVIPLPIIALDIEFALFFHGAPSVGRKSFMEPMPLIVSVPF